MGVWRSICILAVCWPTILVIVRGSRLEAAVISEIYYNAPAGSEALEFIEIVAETTTPEDLSGWEFVDGIQYVFSAGTILHAGGAIVVCKDVEAVRAHYGINNALGNYTGSLAGSGERVTLVNQVGVVVQSVRYDDEGEWPVGPDGSGHTLSLAGLYLDPSEPESWVQSVQRGGTPGLLNFPLVTPFGRAAERAPLIEVGAVWRYREGRGPFGDGQVDWRQADFDDATWSEGATPIGNSRGDEATVLADMAGNYTSVACRAHVQLGEAEIHGPRDLFLALEFDEGFCAWMNGEEIARLGCSEGADWDSTATGVDPGAGDPGKPAESLFPIPRHVLRLGDNVLCILGLGLGDELERDVFRVSPRVLRMRRPAEESAPGPGLVLNELFRGASPGDGWVEIFNAGSWTMELSGYHLTDNADRIGAGTSFTFGPDTSIGPGEFLVVSASSTAIDFLQEELRLFLARPDLTVLAAHVFRRPGPFPPLQAAPGTFSEASFPDGGRPGWLTPTPTPGAPNEVPRETNLVINEIFYHPPDDPPGEPRSEFLELFNRGTTPIDLGGFRFTRGIDYAFEGADTSIGPGAYLVLAKDPALLAEHYGYDRALGPYEGFLANDGENIRLVDRIGNLVDEVRYFEGGEWSAWADGRGASLELIDPSQDNDFGAAWDASDESAKASWEELSYSVPAHVPSETASEFHLFLVEKGVCRIDDVSIQRGGEANFIPNPGFEEARTAPWVIEGTHVHSRRITTDSYSGSACLEVVATGSGNSRVNRLEVETRPDLTEAAYDVSLWARWQRGTSLIITHSDFTPGEFEFQTGGIGTNLSGNTFGARLRMTVPCDLGTPGAENSVRLRHRQETGSDNLGPVIRAVMHSPAVPLDSEPIGVTARVSDPDGVAEVRVWFRPDGAGLDPDFQSLRLFDNGRRGDGKAGDGLYRGEMPGFARDTAVAFYVEANDALGGVLRSPRAAPDETYAILVRANQLTRDTTQILLSSARTAELNLRQLHSNDLLHGTFVLNESEVFYNVGVRYRGSSWGRTERRNFRVRFASERPFLRGLKEVNVSSRSLRGNTTDEGSAYFVIGRLGTREHRAAVPQYLYVDGSLNGEDFGVQAAFEPVNRGYISRWYGDEIIGPVLKADGRQNFNDFGAIDTVHFASLTYMGEHSERYRMYWKHSLRQTHDDWQPFVDLCKVMDPAQTSDEEFDLAVDDVLDVEQFFRVHAARILMGDTDAMFAGNGHNAYLVRNSTDRRWTLVPFDMDGRFGLSGNFFRSSSAAVSRMFERRPILRTYYRVLEDYVNGYWSQERAGPWLDALEEATAISTDAIKDRLARSNELVREELRKLEKAFRVFLPAEVVVEVGAPWSFRRGTGPFSDPPTAWREPEFDDADWETGPTPFGFGDVTEGTVLSDMQNNYTTLALRKRFELTAERIDEEYCLVIAYDDGFCAYLNGQEIGRANAGGAAAEVAWDSTASDFWELTNEEALVPLPSEMLVVGENVLTLIALNGVLAGSDFGVVPRLVLRPRTLVATGPTARLLGEAPFRVATMEVQVGSRPSRPLRPTWTSVVAWSADFEIDPATTRIVVNGFDGLGQPIASGSIDVQATVSETFLRGEVTGDGVVNLNDALAIVRYLFQHGPSLCLDAADVEDDGRVTVLDAIRLILYLFAQGEAPAAPFAAPGPDPTPDWLDCRGG